MGNYLAIPAYWSSYCASFISHYFSTPLVLECETWKEHSIMYDHQVREIQLKKLVHFKNGKEISLCHAKEPYEIGSALWTLGVIKIVHWSVVCEGYSLEFSSSKTANYGGASVCINSIDYVLDKPVQTRIMNEQIRDRMRHVLGMCNYSLCLRNSEQVANYVFNGNWTCNQLKLQDENWLKTFKSLLGDNMRKVNVFPSPLYAYTYDDDGKNKERIYSFLDDGFKFNKVDCYLDLDVNTYNILVVGPTGAGKSHVINILFNKHVCNSQASHQSVTQDIYFIRGEADIFNHSRNSCEKRDIILADTVGLCDTEWNDEAVCSMITNRVGYNVKHIDLVILVIRTDRLTYQQLTNITLILKWLKYDHSYLRFLIVATHADHLTEEEKVRMKQEAFHLLNLKSTTCHISQSPEPIESFQFVGFPPEDTLNELTKKKVYDSRENLLRFVKYSTAFEDKSILPYIGTDGQRHCSVL